MKVLSVLDTLEIGGAEVSLLEIYRRFENTEVGVCQLYPGDRLAASYRAAGLRVVALNLSGKYAFWSGWRRLGQVVREERPDLLLATLFRAGIVTRLVARRSGIPLIDAFVNDSYSPYRWQALSPAGRLKLRAVWLLDRLTARWATWFTAVSASVRDSNCRALGVPPERVSVIHRGRDPQRFRRLDRSEQAEVRAALGVDDRQPLLLNVARLLPRKGQHELLGAMLRVLDEHPRAVLWLAGEGEGRASLETQTRELGLTDSVRLLGSRQDVPRLLGAADLFVFPSHYEGHAGALVEAMMAGLPIVATDTSIHRESVTEGETARLVPIGEPEALARAICELLREREWAERMGARARQVALERFPIDRVAARHEALYREIARGRSGEAGGRPGERKP